MTYRLNATRDNKTTLADIATQASALLQLSGRVYLGDKFVAMATNLGYGFWITCYDRIFILPPDDAHPDGQTMGRAEPPPDRIHVEGQEVEWSVELPLRPLLLMKVRVPITPPSLENTAKMADLLTIEYTKMWRIGYQSWHDHLKVEPDEPPYISEGRVFYELDYGYFRCGSDKLDLMNQRTFNVHGGFESPHRSDYGAPVVLADGRLAAVLIGGDMGPESSHQGAIIPIELILPFRDVWKARVEHHKGEFSSKYYFSIHH